MREGMGPCWQLRLHAHTCAANVASTCPTKIYHCEGAATVLCAMYCGQIGTHMNNIITDVSLGAPPVPDVGA